MREEFITRLRRHFNINKQGFTLFKVMMFIYVFKICGIVYPFISSGKRDVKSHLNALCELSRKSLEMIKQQCEEELYNLVKECIESFRINISLNLSIISALNVIENMTVEDINYYFINEVGFIVERNNVYAPKELVELIVGLLKRDDRPQSWCDLNCKSGNALVEISKMNNRKEIIGIDSDNDYLLLTKIRLYFMKSKSTLMNKDFLRTRFEEFVDVSYINGPLNYRMFKQKIDFNSFNKYISDIKTIEEIGWVYVDRLLQVISDRGVAVMTDSSLDDDINIDHRKRISEKNVIEGIIKLPDNIFPFANEEYSLVF